MNKEEALQDFLASLKTSLNNAAVYFKDHHVFLKSAEDLKAKADSLLVFLSPIKIGISPNSLFIDGKNWEKSGLSKELASFFHFRKVETVEIKSGVSLKELIFFISKVSLAPKEILKAGGIEAILKKENMPFILAKGLDYSRLLGIQGKEYKDIWTHMFQEAAEKGTPQDIFGLADNFGKIIEKFKVNDLLENEDLRKNIYNFFNYLKDEAKDKFNTCSKDIAKLILRDKAIAKIDKLEKLRVFFKDLSGDEVSDILWEAAASDKDFDALSFELLSSLLDKNQHERAALSLADKIKTKNPPEVNPQAVKRLKDLFFAAKDQAHYGPYRKNLEFLFKNTFFEEAGSRGLDLESTRASYQFLILNSLIGEKNKTKLSLLKDLVKEELDSVIKNKDTEFLRHFLEICERRRKESSFSGVFDPVKNDALSSIENIIFQGSPRGEAEGSPRGVRLGEPKAGREAEGAPGGGFEGFLNLLNRSFLGEQYYLNKIFNENRISPGILKMYFKFFPDTRNVFYDNLKKKSPDAEFLKILIEAVQEIHSALSLEILRNIFSFSHSLVKLEILKAMRELPQQDENLLFSILKEENVFLRKEALGVLVFKEGPGSEAGQSNAVAEALKLLLDMPDSWGKKNKVLEENIDIVVEEGLTEPARDFLLVLSRRGFFWNKKVKEKAKAALESLFGGQAGTSPA